MGRKKKQNSNLVGWVILGLMGLMGLGIYHFGIMGNLERPAKTATTATPAAKPAATAPSSSRAVPLDVPRFVNVASLNVRHTPSTSGPLIMALPRGTPLRVLGRQDGWLLIDINPTLEGWVSERLTTTRSPPQPYMPPAPLIGSR